MRPAIVVVDMLKDAFKRKNLPSTQEYVKIVPKIKRLLNKARELNIPIFVKDNVKWEEKIQEFPMR